MGRPAIQDETRLPAWAQERLNRLRDEVENREADLDNALRALQFQRDEYGRYRFLGRHCVYFGDSLSVSYDKGTLTVMNQDGAINVRPQSGNVVNVTGGPF